MEAIQEHFRRMQQVLKSVGTVAKTSNHNVTRGTLREYFLREFLQPILPHDIGVVSGEIIDSFGNRSGQVDCILVDKTLPQIYLGSPDHLIVLAESVLAAIEVKSNLTCKELRKTLVSNLKIKRLRRLGVQRFENGVEITSECPIATFVFAYQGVTLGRLLNLIKEFALNPPDSIPNIAECLPNSTCVLNKGLIKRDPVKITAIGNQFQLPSNPKVQNLHLEKDTLYLFLITLLDEILPSRTRKVDLGSYFKRDNLE
ncbi:MAG: hypothetical protein KA239_06090 [Bacteroidia bacterium]|nr:hypothetical protein [Bacteroidia bacterium]